MGSTVEMNALETALSQIQANGASGAARQAVLSNDSRMVRLREIHQHYTAPITGHGMLGGMQTFMSLASVENMQVLRARALIQARINQLHGYRPGVVSKLARAAEIRRQISARTA